MLGKRKETTEEKMVTGDSGRRLGKPCGLSVPSLGRAKPPWHMPQPEPENGIWRRPYTDTWDLHTTVPKIHGKGKCSGFRAVFLLVE